MAHLLGSEDHRTNRSWFVTRVTKTPKNPTSMTISMWDFEIPILWDNYSPIFRTLKGRVHYPDTCFNSASEPFLTPLAFHIMVVACRNGHRRPWPKAFLSRRKVSTRTCFWGRGSPRSSRYVGQFFFAARWITKIREWAQNDLCDL